MKVLRPEDAEMIKALEERRLSLVEVDEVEREFARWHALWRPESLEHYLQLGWSFGLFSTENELLGYFLAQPFLFFRGMTQTLWVEHLAARDAVIEEQLIELAVRCARDKHMQKVVFFSASRYEQGLKAWKPQRLDEQSFEVKTARF